MDSFTTIYERAAKRKGGVDALEDLLPKAKTARSLVRVKDDRYLSEMTKCVFRSGFVWQIIERKWPGFEEAFDQFDVTTCSMLGDEAFETLVQNANIVRNGMKIRAVQQNAAFILSIRQSHGSFGKFLSQWPADDFVGLWQLMKKEGGRLGGQTGRFFLRFVGKDTPILSADVVTALMQQNVVDKPPTSQKALGAVQSAFNEWHAQSGRDYCTISRTLSCSVSS